MAAEAEATREAKAKVTQIDNIYYFFSCKNEKIEFF